MKSASSALKALLKGLGMDGALNLGRIIANWNALFKGALSFHTSPDSIKGGTLMVNVDSPAWLHQAGFYKSDMLKKLRPYGVRFLRFSLGKVDKADAHDEAAPPVARELSQAERAAVDGMISGIKDNQLRQSIRRAALKSVATSGKIRDMAE